MKLTVPAVLICGVLALLGASGLVLGDTADPYPGSGGKILGTPSSAPKFDPAKVAHFAVGTTTKADVVSALGKPAGWVTSPDGTSQLQYAYSGQTSMLGSQRLVKIEYASFSFDANRKLTRMECPGRQ